MTHTLCLWFGACLIRRSDLRNKAGVAPRRLDLCECVTRGRVNQFGMQQPAVASSSATSPPQRDFGAAGQLAGDGQERVTEAEVVTGCLQKVKSNDRCRKLNSGPG
jgi:hypothetical protein